MLAPSSMSNSPNVRDEHESAREEDNGSNPSEKGNPEKEWSGGSEGPGENEEGGSDDPNKKGGSENPGTKDAQLEEVSDDEGGGDEVI